MALKNVAILAFAFALALGGVHCKKNETPRCGRCGMVVDPKSAFQAELDMPDTGGKLAFDSPKCALKHRATRKVRTTLRVQEYYSRTWVGGADVRLIAHLHRAVRVVERGRQDPSWALVLEAAGEHVDTSGGQRRHDGVTGESAVRTTLPREGDRPGAVDDLAWL